MEESVRLEELISDLIRREKMGLTLKSTIRHEYRLGHKICTTLRSGDLIPILDVGIIVQIFTPVYQVTDLLIKVLIFEIEIFFVEFFDHFLFLLLHFIRKFFTFIIFLSFLEILYQLHFLLLFFVFFIKMFQPFEFGLN